MRKTNIIVSQTQSNWNCVDGSVLFPLSVSLFCLFSLLFEILSRQR